MSIRVKLHWAERFINFITHNTKLYIHGERGADWAKAHKLRKELFDQLVPFLDELKDEARKEGFAEGFKHGRESGYTDGFDAGHRSYHEHGPY